MMAMKNFLTGILKSLATPAARSSTDLKADLAKIDMQALEADVDAIERRRRDALLRGTDAQVAAIMSELAAANLAAERGQAAIDELQRLIAEAEAREAGEQLEQQAAQAQEAGETIGSIYAEIDGLAAKIRALLGAAGAHADTLRRWNTRAERAGLANRRVVYADPAAVKQKLHGAFR